MFIKYCILLPGNFVQPDSLTGGKDGRQVSKKEYAKVVKEAGGVVNTENMLHDGLLSCGSQVRFLSGARFPFMGSSRIGRSASASAFVR